MKRQRNNIYVINERESVSLKACALLFCLLISVVLTEKICIFMRTNLQSLESRCYLCASVYIYITCALVCRASLKI